VPRSSKSVTARAPLFWIACHLAGGIAGWLHATWPVASPFRAGPRLEATRAVWHETGVEKRPAIDKDCFVTIAYSIFTDGDSKPVDLGDQETRTTLSYVHGYGLALPALEKGLEGEAVGTELTIEAEPEDAFGVHEPEGVFEVGKEDFADADELEVGDELVAEGPDGSMMMRVIELRDDSFVVDTNHPLAGKKVRFDVEIVGVRPATEEEIAEAQDDAEDLAAEDGCCGHDHDHDHAHGHDHSHGGHDHAHADTGEPLVQLGTRKPKRS
jgi:FKBP-type peptidyl-prolyl cis-trans isomerase SlyD